MERQPLDEKITVNCTGNQKERWEIAAELDERQFSDWVRRTLDKAARSRNSRRAGHQGKKSRKP